MINNRKVVDCTFFNDEVDLLEIRGMEHNSFVDFFVVVEGSQTFAGIPKPFYSARTPVSYPDKWKIVQITDFPEGDSWVKERYSREMTTAGVNELLEEGLIDLDDYVIISDVDEIINHKCFHPSVITEDYEYFNFDLSFRYYFMNCRSISQESWKAPVMTTVRNYTDPNALRQHGNRYRMKDIHCAGWHFSWLGDTEKIIAKIESTAHREIDNPMIKDRAHIEECLRTGKDILNRPGYEWQFLNDMNYPEYVIGNIERFGKYFSPRRA